MTQPQKGSQRLTLALTAVRMGPALMLLVLVIVLSLLTPVFLSGRNLGNIGLESSVVALLALGQLLVIITAGIDLSVGSVIAFSSILGALWVRHTGIVDGWLIIPTMVLGGALAGAISGTLFVKGKLPHPFLATLAMMMVARGAALLISDGSPITGMPVAIQALGSKRILGVPVAVILVLVLAVLVHILLTRITWGLWIYAVGANKEGAKRVGIPVDRVLISVYVMSGFFAGVAGLVVSGQTNSAYPTAGMLLELSAIAAVIIGGASFFGGRGTVFGAMVGALILGVIQNGLNLLNVNPSWQYVALGTVVVLAVELDVVRQRLENRLKSARTEESKTGEAQPEPREAIAQEKEA